MTVFFDDFDDFTEDELDRCIHLAYDDTFDTPFIAPVVSLTDGHYLELFHGELLPLKI